MSSEALFDLSVVFGLVVWSIVALRYVWPGLRDRPRPEALRPLLLLHAFRFVGLSFLIPGVVSPDLPPAFARPAAYGDLATALLALIAALLCGTGWDWSLRGRSTSSAPSTS